MMLYKYIGKEDIDNMKCPYCHSDKITKGTGIGHGCKYDDSSKPNPIMALELFCEYCHLRFIVPASYDEFGPYAYLRKGEKTA